MTSDRLQIVLRRFDTPDEVGPMEKGRFELVQVGGMTIGRATYEPGWRWSVHVGPTRGQRLCPVEHVGLVLSGTATAAFEDGTVRELTAGTLFYIPPVPHDSWVVGDEEYVSLHFLGAEAYAQPARSGVRAGAVRTARDGALPPRALKEQRSVSPRYLRRPRM